MTRGILSFALALIVIGCASHSDPSPREAAPRDSASGSPETSDAGATPGSPSGDAGFEASASSPDDASSGVSDAGLPSPHDAGPAVVPDAASTCPNVDELLRGDCSGCHRAHSSLDLASPSIASRLAGQAAYQGGLLLDPAHPASSVLYEKLGPNPPFGARMPLSLPPYDATTMACILTWITGP